MVVEFVFGVVVGFVIVVIGSYIGATMALNTYFGRDVAASKRGQSTGSESRAESDGTNRE